MQLNEKNVEFELKKSLNGKLKQLLVAVGFKKVGDKMLLSEEEELKGNQIGVEFENAKVSIEIERGLEDFTHEQEYLSVRVDLDGFLAANGVMDYHYFSFQLYNQSVLKETLLVNFHDRSNGFIDNPYMRIVRNIVVANLMNSILTDEKGNVFLHLEESFENKGVETGKFRSTFSDVTNIFDYAVEMQKSEEMLFKQYSLGEDKPFIKQSSFLCRFDNLEEKEMYEEKVLAIHALYTNDEVTPINAFGTSEAKSDGYPVEKHFPIALGGAGWRGAEYVKIDGFDYEIIIGDNKIQLLLLSDGSKYQFLFKDYSEFDLKIETLIQETKRNNKLKMVVGNYYEKFVQETIKFISGVDVVLSRMVFEESLMIDGRRMAPVSMLETEVLGVAVLEYLKKKTGNNQGAFEVLKKHYIALKNNQRGTIKTYFDVTNKVQRIYYIAYLNVDGIWDIEKIYEENL